MSYASLRLPISKDLLLIYIKVNERRRQLRSGEKKRNNDRGAVYQKYLDCELQNYETYKHYPKR